jgi:hypothetical protein
VSAPFRVPDAISPVVGYRVWVASTDAAGAPVLRSVFRDLEWPTSGPLAADCVAPLLPLGVQQHVDEELPVRSCTCGVYLLKAPEVERWCSRQPASLRPGFIVGGLASGWGKYLEAPGGYRVQFARPAALVRRPLPNALRPGEQTPFARGLPLEADGEAWIESAAVRYGIETIDGWAPV